MLSLITIQRELDETWRWSGYDELGARMGFQDRCTDPAEAAANALEFLLNLPPAAIPPEAIQPKRKAAKPKPPRIARKSKSGRGH